jgi:hypothetical protein
MNPNRLIALFAGGAGLAGAALLFLRRDEEGIPAMPVELEEIGSGDVGAGIPTTQDEVEALARTIASEAGSGTQDEQRAIGWTVRNRFRGKSIYAKQQPWRAQKGSDPPFSSARPASDVHRKLALEILQAPQSQDPTGGATSFFEPRMQDAFTKAGALARSGETGDRVIDGVKLSDITRFKNYKKSADDIRKSWSNGSALYKTVGRFEFWGRAKRGSSTVGSLDSLAA